MKRPLAALAIGAVVAVGLVTPTSAAIASDSGLTAKARWVNNTVTVVYSWSGEQAPATSGDLAIRVGATLIADASTAQTDRILTATRTSGTTVTVSAALKSCVPNPQPVPAATSPAEPTPADGTAPSDSTAPSSAVPTASPTPTSDVVEPTCTYSMVWSADLKRETVKQKAGQVSAATLLGTLKVKAESHSTSYSRSKFKLWVDADHDGENTRAEVLKAESTKKVKENSHHTVTTGRWVSTYDGNTYTIASKLDIDHLVPLEEAWTSGAYAWTATKRTAYANDLGYAASLIAVSQHANRSKGDKEPNAYLPPKTTYICAYVRNYIAVKYRWGLTVDAAEKAALGFDLASYCVNPNVTKPGRPSLTALVSVPRSSGRSSSSGGSSSGGSSGGGSSSSSSSGSSSSAPAGATAICRDGTYSYSQHRSGTCSHHGGVSVWL
jgi:uncharacterized membrane protein YgcG